MSVYVDPMATALMNPNWRWPKACHLYADTLQELHDFAVGIGLNRSWFQERPSLPHYDLTARMRRIAIRAGAIQHSARQMLVWWRARKPTAAASRARFLGLLALMAGATND